MPENIEHNASIIGRNLCNSMNSKIVITKRSIYSNRTISNSNRTNTKLTVLLEYIDLFCDMHFDK